MPKGPATAFQALLRRTGRPSALKQRRAPPVRRHATTDSNASNPADRPDFVSVVDAPPKIVSTRRKHTALGIAVLSVIPLTAFALGTWQVQRLDWKTKLIATFEDRLVRPPLPLPPRVDPDAIADFDYRRVVATGRFQHDREMLVGPRTHDGKDGFLVITPLARPDGAETILVNRGWISREMRFQQDRDPASLPGGDVTVAGLLRQPWTRNFFTPDNQPEKGKFYFPDVHEMARASGSAPVWIEETMTPDLLLSFAREAKGIPIGRAAEVNLRNNHLQYIFTWYSLSAATALMMWMVLKKKPNDVGRRVRHSTNW